MMEKDFYQTIQIKENISFLESEILTFFYGLEPGKQFHVEEVVASHYLYAPFAFT